MTEEETRKVGPEGYDEMWDGLNNPYSGYYGRDGERISMRQWCSAFERKDKQRVAETTVGDYWVSTVWLGMDHSFGEGPPLIFETMIFNHSDVSKTDDEDFLDLWCERYPTEAAALAGHERAVAMVQEKVNLLKEATKEG